MTEPIIDDLNPHVQKVDELLREMRHCCIEAHGFLEREESVIKPMVRIEKIDYLVTKAISQLDHIRLLK